jgi:uncharacterized protein
MIQYLIVPGYGNSGEGHWQTWIENELPGAIRIQQQSWEQPQCNDWVQAIQDAVQQYDAASVVLICHSLGNIAVAHWAVRFPTKIKAALLVAPADIEHPYAELGLQSFKPIPQHTLPFPSLLVASSNDHWITAERAEEMAHQWGSRFHLITEAGHINTDAGYGEWPEGLQLLQHLLLT